MENENIKIKTFKESDENYEIFPVKQIEGEFFNFSYEKELSLSHISDKDEYTLIILHQTKKVDNNNINYMKLNAKISKWLENGQIAKISIEIRNEKLIQIKEFNMNFFYFDLEKIDEKTAFLFIFLFNQAYYYKICEKENNLDYIELKSKSTDNDIKKSYTYLFVGNSIYNENILEYVFLEKPKNYFLYFLFDLSSIEKNSNELNLKIIKRRLVKNISEKFTPKKFWRGLNNDKFVFIEGKSFYMILKDNNEEANMLIYPFEISYENNKIFPDRVHRVPFLIKIMNKMYIMIDFSKIEKTNSNYKQVILVSFEIYFDSEKNMYKTNMLQKIYVNINSNDGKYDLNRISANKILIIDDYTIYFIILNDNFLVKNIYQFLKLNNESNSSKIYYINDNKNFFKAFIINSKLNSIDCYKIDKNRYAKKDANDNILSNENLIHFNLNEYLTFINSEIKIKTNDLFKEKCEILDKKINSKKEKIQGEKIENEKHDKKLENLSLLVVETVEDIPDEQKKSKYNISDFQEKKYYQKNKYKNFQPKQNIKANANQINYQNNNKPKNFYNNNSNYINNNINNNPLMNNTMQHSYPSYNFNQINNVEWLNQLNKLNPMNPMNHFNKSSNVNYLNNIQSQNNNANLIQNSMNNNNFIHNPQIYQNINQNFLNYK